MDNSDGINVLLGLSLLVIGPMIRYCYYDTLRILMLLLTTGAGGQVGHVLVPDS